MTSPLGREPDRMVPWVHLRAILKPMEAPPGLVFSTGPRLAIANPGGLYCVKGPDPVVVAAEASAYVLARQVELPTPEFGVGRDPESGRDLFASRLVRTREVEMLLRRNRVSNRGVLHEIGAFDVWIANGDRNVNNLIAEPDGGPAGNTVTLQAIDFERSELLRGESIFVVTERHPSRYWLPSVVAQYAANLPAPRDMVRRIRALSADRLGGLLDQVRIDLGLTDMPWIDAAARGLHQRGQSLEQLLREATRQ